MVGMAQMALEGKILQTLERSLATVDEQGTRGTRLVDDAKRLWARVQLLLAMKLVEEAVDQDALHLACYALQLSARTVGKNGGGRSQRHSPRDRAGHAAEMLAALLPADNPIAERASQILTELPLKSPARTEAKLLSDAVNLDDFGVTAMLLQAVQLSRTGSGVSQVLDGLEKREQYGYWDARLKDGFHFDAVRQIARHRLENTRKAAALLRDEMGEDRAT